MTTAEQDGILVPTQTKGPGAGQTHSPRVLSFTVSFYVKPGLRANIRMKKVVDAADQFKNLVEVWASRIFPWADEVEISATYDYRWWGPKGSRVRLPATPENGL